MSTNDRYERQEIVGNPRAAAEESAFVIVTGAGSGIGSAIARRLHSDRFHVVLADLDGEGVGKLATELNNIRHESALGVELDVSDRTGWTRLADTVRSAGPVFGLVNNAGITRDKSMLSMTDQQFDQVIDVHLKGRWLGIQAVVPLLREHGSGSIVNISSVGRHGVFGQTNYSAAKAGIVGLTKAVALEQAKYQIRSNAVAPGAIETPMLESVPEAVKDSWRSSILLNRLGRPEEIAGAVSFLMSGDAAFVNAIVLDVNGGEPHL